MPAKSAPATTHGPPSSLVYRPIRRPDNAIVPLATALISAFRRCRPGHCALFARVTQPTLAQAVPRLFEAPYRTLGRIKFRYRTLDFLICDIESLHPITPDSVGYSESQICQYD